LSWIPSLLAKNLNTEEQSNRRTAVFGVVAVKPHYCYAQQAHSPPLPPFLRVGVVFVGLISSMVSLDDGTARGLFRVSKRGHPVLTVVINALRIRLQYRAERLAQALAAFRQIKLDYCS
jgi:hypothetical protein